MDHTMAKRTKHHAEQNTGNAGKENYDGWTVIGTDLKVD
jgi:hypothetical protein